MRMIDGGIIVPSEPPAVIVPIARLLVVTELEHLRQGDQPEQHDLAADDPGGRAKQ